MSQHSSHGGNNGADESFTQQNQVNTNPEKSTSSTVVSQRPEEFNVPVNIGITNIFYKTRMCHKFIKGECQKGDGCTFAHGPHDLRQPPPNWQQLVKDNRSGNWNDDENIIQKMRICRNFYNGDTCPYGENCSFLHQSPAKFKIGAPMDIGRARETTVVNIPTMVDHGQSQLGVNQVATDPNALRAFYWKTRMCGKWETIGKCVYADKCSFAHGAEELNTRVRRMEDEGHAHAHPYVGGSMQLNPVYGSTIEPQAAGSVGTVVHGQQGEHRQPRGFAKLANKKLKGIYADWIDDDEADSS